LKISHDKGKKKYGFGGLWKREVAPFIRSKLKDKKLSCYTANHALKKKMKMKNGVDNNFENLSCHFHGGSMNENLQDINFMRKAALYFKQKSQLAS